MADYINRDDIPAELIKQGVTFVALWKRGRLLTSGRPDSEAIKDALAKIQPISCESCKYYRGDSLCGCADTNNYMETVFRPCCYWEAIDEEDGEGD